MLASNATCRQRLTNFQQHERKRSQLLKLREQFEQDKSKIAKMREARAFKPY